MTRPYMQSRILNRLRLAAGGVVKVTELVEAVYFDRANGGPDYAASCIVLGVMALRRRGFPIQRAERRGYRFAPTFWQVGDAA